MAYLLANRRSTPKFASSFMVAKNKRRKVTPVRPDQPRSKAASARAGVRRENSGPPPVPESVAPAADTAPPVDLQQEKAPAIVATVREEPVHERERTSYDGD